MRVKTPITSRRPTTVSTTAAENTYTSGETPAGGEERLVDHVGVVLHDAHRKLRDQELLKPEDHEGRTQEDPQGADRALTFRERWLRVLAEPAVHRGGSAADYGEEDGNAGDLQVVDDVNEGHRLAVEGQEWSPQERP